MRWLPTLLTLLASVSASSGALASWQPAAAQRVAAVDDDIQRNIVTAGYFDGIEISEYRFSENGFEWHLLRFASAAMPDGPLWMVPHDDENAAFDAMITAIKEYGGVGIAVNSGPGSVRQQTGRGVCGVRLGLVLSCDPNRNFDAKAPLFASAFLSLRPDHQPVIALHTNSPGFAGDGHGGRGDISILDRAAYGRGEIVARNGGIFAKSPQPGMANYDTLGLTAYLAKDDRPKNAAAKCGRAIANSGVHFWHERVKSSDGSMSNYLALNRPDIAYFNAESRMEIDLAVAAARHKIMIAAYLANCAK
jgi:hypothetical protein